MTKKFSFTTKPGLWVSSSFTDKFFSDEITPAKSVPEFKKLERYMNDSEIQKELGPSECTLEDVAAFLTNPPKGTDDGYWNIFYVAGCVVFVVWNSDGREWYVRAWYLDDDRWYAGSRVFARNWHSVPSASSGTESLGSLETRIATLEAVIKHHNLGV